MKPYLEYKRLFSFIIIGLSLLMPIVFSFAETIEELNSKINQKNIDITALEQEIEQYQTELNLVGKQKKSLSNSIKELDLNKKKLTVDIALTQKKIDKTNLKIQGLNSQIITEQNSISNNINSLGLYIRKTDEFENESIVEILLSNNDFTTAWNDIDNMATVREKIRDKIIELKEIKSELEDTRKETIDAKKELILLKTNLADQKKIIEQNTTEKKKLLAETKNSEINYQKLLKNRLAKKEAFEKEVRDYESKISFILDPTKLPGAGVLSWPLDYIYITQFFGKTEAGKRLYANGTHNGVDFRASVGTPLKAMADGKVLGTGNTDLTCLGASFGKFIFIQYDNGLSSTYGHLSLIKVYEGQRVTRGEIVGYTGNTGYSTGPHLHVSLYASGAVKMESRPSRTCGGRIYTMPIAPVNAYLDPMYYLPRL